MTTEFLIGDRPNDGLISVDSFCRLPADIGVCYLQDGGLGERQRPQALAVGRAGSFFYVQPHVLELASDFGCT